MKRFPAWPSAMMLAAVLSACGGGGSSSSDDGETPADTQSVNGVLVRPASTTESAQRVAVRQGLIDAPRERALSAECPAVPDGYDPLASVEVAFRNAEGTVVATLTTDSCGAFSGTIPVTAEQATAEPDGIAPIAQPVSALVTVVGSGPALVSGLPEGADYVISVVQDLGSGRVAMTVTDSASGKAVLGLTDADFDLAVGPNPVTLGSLSYGASQAQQNASVAMVMDSSGSMFGEVGTTDKSALQVAAAAGHELLDGLQSGADQAGVVLFSSNVYVMNDATLAFQSWVTPAGAARPAYSFSPSGLTGTLSELRPVVDAYNHLSQIYAINATNANADAVHADTGDLRISGSYPYSGATAFFDGTMNGIALLDGASNERKIVVAMTDGQDNNSDHSVEEVIAQAQAEGIPLYTVGFGAASDVNEEDMQAMADQTGGEYKRVEGLDLAGLFQSIQTGIRFQYVATLGAPLGSGSVLTITLNRGGSSVSRDLTIR